MEQRTHEKIAAHLCGTPLAISEGRARVALDVSAEMAADGRGLAHGGFTFGLADYAAMLAVNEPTVVLAGATLKFLGPVVVGDRVEAEATVERFRELNSHRLRAMLDLVAPDDLTVVERALAILDAAVAAEQTTSTTTDPQGDTQS